MDILTTAQLQAQIESDLKTRLGISSWGGKLAIKALSWVQAARLKLIYILIGFVLKNIWVDTSDDELKGGTLQRFGRVKLKRNPYPAIAGVYILNVTGKNGGTIYKGQTFKSTLNSLNPDYMFEVYDTVVLSGTTGQIIVTALIPGVASELQDDDELESTSPILNVDSLAIVDSIDTMPIAAEDLEDYRALCVQAFREEPQGGSSTDYRVWARDINGIRTVYPYCKNNATYTVQIYIECLPDNTAPGQPDGYPTQDMIDAVWKSDFTGVLELDPDTTKSIDERGRRPVQAILEPLPVNPIGVTITIVDLSDKSSSVIADIEDALIGLLYTVRPYIPGADGENRKDVLTISEINAVIYDSIDSDVYFSSVNMSISSVIYNSYQFGEIPSKYGAYPYLQSLLTP